MVKARCAMNKCPVKITIQRQVNESGEPNNNRTVLFQGDVYHIVGDIQARRITYDENEKIRPEFTADFKLKPSKLYQNKKNSDIENQSFAGGNRSDPGRSLKSFQNISSKNNISRDSPKSLVQKVTELQKEFIDIGKKQFSNKIIKEIALWTYALPVYFTFRS